MNDAQKPAPESLLERIRKLLAKAEGVAAEFPGEAEALTTKATELMSRWGIEQTALSINQPALNVITDKIFTLDPPFPACKQNLLRLIAKALGCRCVILKIPRNDGQYRYTWRLHVFGFRSDVERTEILYTSLLLQTARTLSRTPVPRGQGKSAFRQSWLLGFATAIYYRLAEQEQEARAEYETANPGQSLMVIPRGELVAAARAHQYPNLGQSRGRSSSGRGRRAGYAEGMRADLGGRSTVTPGGRRALA